MKPSFYTAGAPRHTDVPARQSKFPAAGSTPTPPQAPVSTLKIAGNFLNFLLPAASRQRGPKRLVLRNCLALLMLATVLFSLPSCRKVTGKGPVVKETRALGNFSEVSFEIGSELRFVPSDNHEVVIEAQRNIIEVIETNISENELRIKVRNGTSLRSNEDIRITVRGPAVSSFTVNGSGNLEASKISSPGEATIRVNGSGSVRIDEIDSDGLSVRISGSGKIRVLSGAVNNEEVSISGSGDVDLASVQARTASTETSGSGTIRLQVSDALNVKISGSGSVYYKGNPSVNTNISGSGTVVRLD